MRSYPFFRPTQQRSQTGMKRKSTDPANLRLQLFVQDQPRVALLSTQKAQLSAQVEALFIEIAEALATGEAGDDQDHR
jgi:hypothetical protein